MPLTFLAADPTLGLPASLGTLAHLWPLWLPLLAGGLAIFWLLPRPRQYPWTWGAIAGLLALALGGIHLIRAGLLGNHVEAGLFYAFSAIAIGSGALLVTQRNPARAALSFALVVLSTCGLFLLLAAPFLMAATIIVYAGAIVVTFLFVLMLAQQEGLSNADARSREPLLATVTGFVLLGALLYVLQLGYDTSELDGLLNRVQMALGKEDPQEMNTLVGGASVSDDIFERLSAMKGMRDDRIRAEAISIEWSMSINNPEKPEAQRVVLRKLEALLLRGASESDVRNLSSAPPSEPFVESQRNPVRHSAMPRYGATRSRACRNCPPITPPTWAGRCSPITCCRSNSAARSCWSPPSAPSPSASATPRENPVP